MGPRGYALRSLRAALVVVLLAGCYLSHEREPRDAAVPDAYVAPDAWTRPIDAAVDDAFWTWPDASAEESCFDRAGAVLPLIEDRAYYEHVAAVDLDGDGRSELVALGRRGTLPPIASFHVFAWRGTLVEVSRTPGTAEYDYPYSVAGTDLDQDGDTDVVAGLGGTRLFENVGGALVDRGLISTEPTTAVATGDVDGDGDVDVVIGGPTDHSPPPLVLVQSGPESFAEETVGARGGTSFVRLLDGPMPSPLVAAVELYTGVFEVHARGPEGWTLVFRGSDDMRMTGITSGDYDLDGLEDFVVFRFGGRAPWFYRQLPGPSFERVLEGNPAIGSAFGSASVDVDGDGDLDVVIGSFRGGPWLYERSNSFEFAEHRGRCSFQALEIHDMTVGDFDGDARLDLVVAATNGAFVIYDFWHSLFEQP